MNGLFNDHSEKILEGLRNPVMYTCTTSHPSGILVTITKYGNAYHVSNRKELKQIMGKNKKKEFILVEK